MEKGNIFIVIWKLNLSSEYCLLDLCVCGTI